MKISLGQIIIMLCCALNQSYYIPPPPISALPPELLELDSTNPQTQSLVILDPQYLNFISLNFEYGIWSQYAPISQVKSIGPVTNSNCAVLNYVLNSQNTQTFFYYVCFDQISQKVKHIVQFICYDQKYQQELKINGKEYEASLPTQNQFFITMMIADGSQYTYQTYNHQFPFSIGLNFLNYGNSVIVTNTNFNDITTLMSFRGRVILYQVVTNTQIPIMHLTYEQIKQLAVSYDTYLYPNCKSSAAYYGLTLTIQSLTEITQSNKMQSAYQIFGWFKIKDFLMTNIEYQIITIASSYKQIGQELFFKKIITNLRYYQTSNGNQEIHFHTYTLKLPNFNVDSVDDIEDIINLTFLLQEWHFIAIYFNQSTMKLKIFHDPIIIEKSYTVAQYTHYEMKLGIGTQLNTNVLQISGVLLQNCPSSETNVVCHSKCKTCSGPSDKECTSCNSNNHRVLKYNQCICQLGYYQDYSSQTCKSNLELNLELIERYDIVEDDSVCPTGSNKYLDNCIKCPGVKSHYFINCMECYNIDTGYSIDWISTPRCYSYYSPYLGNTDNSFLKTTTQTQIYLITDSEAVLCEYCQDICSYISGVCQTYYLSHKGAEAKVYCQGDYTIFNNLCVKYRQIPFYSTYQQPSEYCYNTQETYCEQCIDQKLYYRSLRNPLKCIPCIIQNCEYCMEYSISDKTINSYTVTTPYEYDDDIAEACALCKDGYTYNKQTNKCEFNVPISPCKRQIIDENNNIICLITSQQFPFGNAIQYSQCNVFITNCDQCIVDGASMSCIVCKDGYKVNQSTMQCVQCGFTNYRTCIDVDYNVNDSVVIYFQSFYYYLVGQLYQIQYSYYASEVALSCYSGQEVHDGICINNCDTSGSCYSCSIVDWDLWYTCTKCYASKNGYLVSQIVTSSISTYNQCIECNYLCNFCMTSNYKCILREEIEKYTYIDNQYGMVHFCEQNAKCVKDLIKNYELNCDNKENLFKQYLTSDEIDLRYNKDELQYQQYSQILATRKFTYNFLLTEDLDCSQTNLMFEEMEFQITTFQEGLEGFEYIFRSLNYNKIVDRLTMTIFQGFVSLIQFDGLIILVQPVYRLTKIDYNQNRQSNYLFNNSIFQGNCDLCLIDIQLGNLQDLTFSNIIFKDLNIKHQVIVQFTQPNIQLATINLYNVTFLNCTFEQSSFLNYHDQMIIKLDFVQFRNCTFNQFSFFTSVLMEQNINIQISNLEISQTFINNSNVFEFSPYANVFISDLQINNCIFYDSILFLFKNSIVLQNLIMIDNSIYNSQILYLDLVIYISQLSFQFQDITFKNNYLIGTKIMIFYFKEDQKVYINLYSINHIDQTHGNEANSNILYEIKSYYSKANTQNIETQNVFSISINQFQFYQSTLGYVSFWKECNINNALTNLFSIQGFTSITILNSLFYQLQMIDKVIFNINSESVQSYQNLLIQNITFQSISLVKQNEGILMGFISISLKLEIPIKFKQINFIDNLINYYVQDTYFAPACFLIITAYASEIEMQQIYMNSNYLSNSTSTYFSINGKNVNFTNLTSINNNYKDLTKNVHFDQSIDSKIFYQMVQQHFNIQSNPGIGIITSQSLILTDSQFINGQAYSTNIFSVIGKQNCTFIMNNIIITNQTSNLEINPQIYGCFYIQSQTSILTIDINNITIDNVTNRMESAFLYIYASEYQNVVSMKNLIIRNLFSLSNALISLHQTNSYNTNNNILIQNLNIINEQTKMYQFLQKLREITNIYSNNAFIYINKGNVTLSNLTIQGYFPSSLLQIVEVERLIIRNIVFNDISILQSLIQIQITNYFQMHQCFFGNIKQTSIHNTTSFPNNLVPSHYDLSGYQDCSLIIRQDLRQIYEDNLEKENFFYQDQLLMAIQKSIEGLITFSIQNNVKIQISYSEFTNITSESTIFYFDTKSANSILFQKCKFTNNKHVNGSINILSDNQNTILSIRESIFLKNYCNNGCSIYATNIKLNLEKSQFLSNYASGLGAGILIKSVQQLLISKSIFLNNYAKRGGAMYLIGFSLSRENIQNLTMSNNSVIEIYEQPSKLAAQINSKEIPSDYYSNDKMNISHPRQINYIKLPSQQQLKSYKVFNEVTNSYEQNDFNLQFTGLNFQHEQIMDLSNTQCTVTKNIINLTNYEVIKQQNPPLTIEFDTVTNSYNFENVSLVFDPYTHKDYALQLLIKCDSIKDSNYEYLLNVRTFPCQMGEYYFNEGCFMCDYEKGYYSVKKNSTVCYQADINKVQSNTANMLQIQPGYWRANYHTNDIVSCGTMQQYCLGGWKVDHELCFTGHIGALCEECDIYNKYGNGQFFKGTSHNCLLCEESWGPIISLALLSAWTFISISLTVRSMKLANFQYRNLILGHKHFAIIAKYNQDLAGCLIKMLSNQLLVLAAVYQFQQGISFNLFWIEDIASPSLSASFNFDCWLSQQTIIDILYLRTFLILLIPFLYLNLFIWGYLLYIIYKKEKYESSTIYIVIVYLFVVSQPDTIKYNGALITSRNISGEDWVQANVSYLYDTITHHHWMLYAILPILLTWCAIIPLYFATNLYLNRTKLRQTSFRAKWSYLYNEYVPKRYFWEIVKVLQRELQILILTLFFDNIQIKVYLLFFIQFFYLLTITKMQPFNSEQLNRLEIESVQKCILILIFGLTSWSTSNSNLYVINILSYSLLLFTTIVHVAPFLYNILKIYLKKYEENLDSLINIIQSKPILKRFFSRYLGSIIRNKERKKVVKERFDKIKQYLKTRAKSIKQLEKSLEPYQDDIKEVGAIDLMLSPKNELCKSNDSFLNSQRKMILEKQ